MSSGLFEEYNSGSNLLDHETTSDSSNVNSPPINYSKFRTRAHSETRRTGERRHHVVHRRSSSSNSSESSSNHRSGMGLGSDLAFDAEATLTSQLKRLKVSPLNEKQKRKKKRYFRSRMKKVLTEGKLVLPSSIWHPRCSNNPSQNESQSNKNKIISATNTINSCQINTSQQRSSTSTTLSTSSSSSCSIKWSTEQRLSRSGSLRVGEKRRHRHSSDSSSSIFGGNSIPHLASGDLSSSTNINSINLNFSTSSAPLSLAVSTQSLQDFADISRCCDNLQTFTIGDTSENNLNTNPNEVSKLFTSPNFQVMQHHRADNLFNDVSSAPSTTSSHNNRHILLNTNEHQQHKGSSTNPATNSSCAQQARNQEYRRHPHHQDADVSVDDLAGYLEDSIVFPKKMSYMAEMMYT